MLIHGMGGAIGLSGEEGFDDLQMLGHIIGVTVIVPGIAEVGDVAKGLEEEEVALNFGGEAMVAAILGDEGVEGGVGVAGAGVTGDGGFEAIELLQFGEQILQCFAVYFSGGAAGGFGFEDAADLGHFF